MPDTLVRIPLGTGQVEPESMHQDNEETSLLEFLCQFAETCHQTQQLMLTTEDDFVACIWHKESTVSFDF